MPTATAVLTARPITERRRSSSSSAPASMKRAMWAARKTPIAEGEGEGEVAEGLLDAERDDQQRRHRGEDDAADRPASGSMTLVSQA